MNNKLINAAKKAVELKRSEFTEGYEFIKIERLILKYENEPMQVTGADLYITKDNNQKAYICFVTRDNKKYYINTGAIKLVSIVSEWVNVMEGDITQLNEELQKDPVTIKLIAGESKDGTYYSAEILDN